MMMSTKQRTKMMLLLLLLPPSVEGWEPSSLTFFWSQIGAELRLLLCSTSTAAALLKTLLHPARLFCGPGRGVYFVVAGSMFSDCNRIEFSE